MKFFIKKRFAKIINLRKEAYLEENSKCYLELSKYAEELLYSVHQDSNKANRYVIALIRELTSHQLGTLNHFKYSDLSKTKDHQDK